MPAPAAPDPVQGVLLQDAALTLGGKPVLSGLTAHLTEARIGIVGRNGSGKTTLLRLMAGLVAPTSGLVRIAGLDPAADRKAMLHRLGILFQNPDHQIIFPTVAEEVAFGLRQQGRTLADAQAGALAALARFGRGHWAAASVQTLSQGQRHLLCLIAVLAMDPAVILMDEPFAALDLPTAMQLRRRLDALPQQLITISHDPAVLAGQDRVLWLEGGRIHRDGAAGAVLAEFTAEMDRAGEDDADADLAG